MSLNLVLLWPVWGWSTLDRETPSTQMPNLAIDSVDSWWHDMIRNALQRETKLSVQWASRRHIWIDTRETDVMC
jgi:hypothetical protein